MADDNGNGNLRPFIRGDPRAVEMGRRGAETRKRRAAIQRADGVAVLQQVRTLAATARREDLGPAAVAAALDMIGRVTRGEQTVRDPDAWVRVLVDVARLEAGESTSNTIVAHVGARATDHVLALRDQARAALDASSAVQAVDEDGEDVRASPVCDADSGGSDEGGADPLD